MRDYEAGRWQPYTHDELLHVPAVMVGPQVPSGSLGAPTSLMDLAPTLMDLADLDVPDDLDVGDRQGCGTRVRNRKIGRRGRVDDHLAELSQDEDLSRYIL